MDFDTKKKQIVIIGGVAAGASAAAKARRMNEDAEIVILEAGPYISFANCGLPYYVGGEIEKRDSLFVTNAKEFTRRFRVNILTNSLATSIDRKKQIVIYKQGSKVELLHYDRLVLATGTHSILPPIIGLDQDNIFTLRTVQDVDKIRSFLKEHLNRENLKGLVIGGGYIGLEAAEQLLRFDLSVTVVEIADQLMTPMDPEMALPVQTALEQTGATVILRDGLKKISDTSNGTVAYTESGREIPFDFALLCVGVRPATELAETCGLELGDTGAIHVDQHQRTSDPKIFAAGDNSETTHLVTGKPVNIPLAGPANKTGRIAGDNAAKDLLGTREIGERLAFRGVLGTSVVRVCGKLAAVTGLTEKAALYEKIPYEVTYMGGSSHAGYYPGAEPMLLKILSHSESGALLGAQGIGGQGVDKRIDVLATAIMGGMSIEDLEHLDLTYAPPVGSAKDVPIMAGFTGSNTKRGSLPQVTPSELFRLLDGDLEAFVMDVRTSKEFSKGHLEGAVNIPVDDLRERLDEVPNDKRIFLYCRGGYRSYLGTRILINNGWKDVRNVQGGYSLMTQVQKVLT